MTLEMLKTAKRKTIGSKQTVKGICSGRVASVFLAEDADSHVIQPILQLCIEHQLPTIRVESMLILGNACGIQVGAAAAGIIRETE
ncbi:Ribosome-associated protein L7Ae-like protein [bioreactor metagenome]|uniref:Ribosome-associated protein L7Ae-like protein n=1 Tax=bioreactor metagenome TaxID=1076179 RepID=A0A644YLX4_9ZZZZ